MNGSRTWALVMNGVRARILRGVANGDGEDHAEIVSRAALRHMRDMLARQTGPDDLPEVDREDTEGDSVARDMQEFAAETGEVLEQHRRAGDFARLAVFAEARMLAVLRAELPATLRKAVVLELPLNLITLPERELRQRVRAHLLNGF
jgi:protein required for attachment to host cells